MAHGNPDSSEPPSTPPLPPASRTPDLDLPCPTCGYNLRALCGSRCPECGSTFALAELIDRSAAGHSGLFEYVYLRRPVPTFVKTVRATLHPRRFWTRIDAAWRPHPAGLLLFVGFVLSLTWLTHVIGILVTRLGMQALTQFLVRRRPFGDGMKSLLDVVLYDWNTGNLLNGGWISLPAAILVVGAVVVHVFLRGEGRDGPQGGFLGLRVVAYASPIVLVWAMSYQALFLVGNLLRLAGLQDLMPMWPATVCYILRRGTVVLAPIAYVVWLAFGFARWTGARRGIVSALATGTVVALAGWCLYCWHVYYPGPAWGPRARSLSRLPALLWPVIP